MALPKDSVNHVLVLPRHNIQMQKDTLLAKQFTAQGCVLQARPQAL